MKRQLVNLGNVQETLLIPLYLRAVESERNDAICRDPKAVEIVKSLDYDFGKFRVWYMQMDVAVRTEILDETVARFIDQHSDAMIVNLGAGLDARFQRLDNGRILWVDLDMPDAIELRKQFFEENERNHVLARSMFDFAWLDDLATIRGERPVLVVAEGLFVYFVEDDIKALLGTIADRWPGSEILFQSISPNLVNRQHQVGAVNVTQATFRWGITSGRELERWRPDFVFLDEWAFIDRHRRRWRHWRWMPLLFPWAYRRVRETMKISHLRLGNARTDVAGADHGGSR